MSVNNNNKNKININKYYVFINKNNSNLFYDIVKKISYYFLNNVFNCYFLNTNNILKKGSIIFVSNHVSYLDPILIGSVIKKRLFFLSKKQLFNKKLKSFILYKLQCIPIQINKINNKQKKKFIFNITSIKLIYKLLNFNHNILIFPEGTRSKNGLINLNNINNGIGMIAFAHKHIPIIPIKIFEIYKVWNRYNYIPTFNNDIIIKFDKPIFLKDFVNEMYYMKNKKEKYKFLSMKIANKINNIKINYYKEIYKYNTNNNYL